jgi:hypothetical protein
MYASSRAIARWIDPGMRNTWRNAGLTARQSLDSSCLPVNAADRMLSSNLQIELVLASAAESASGYIGSCARSFPK